MVGWYSSTVCPGSAGSISNAQHGRLNPASALIELSQNKLNKCRRTSFAVGSRTPGGSRATRARFRGRGLAGAQRRPFRKTPFSSAPQAIFFLGEGAGNAVSFDFGGVTAGQVHPASAATSAKESNASPLSHGSMLLLPRLLLPQRPPCCCRACGTCNASSSCEQDPLSS